jgi:hypothetical protein
VAAQIGVASGIHIKKAEGALGAHRFGHHGGHDPTVSPGFPGEQLADLVMMGLKIGPFGQHGLTGQTGEAAHQEAGGLPLGVGVDGQQPLRIALEKSLCDTVKLEHADLLSWAIQIRPRSVAGN